MPRNIEIKARVENIDDWFAKVRTEADSGPSQILQDDTFFNCENGRLKLREFSATEGELIFYRRQDCAEPKESSYWLAPIGAPGLLREVLTLAFGQVGRVQKTRNLFLIGRTRIHLDRVERLGDFIELEAVLNEGEAAEAGMRVATELLRKLGISSQSLVAGAYIDLLLQS
jgi:predicted adenylyl cyclase CyaB